MIKKIFRILSYVFAIYLPLMHMPLLLSAPVAPVNGKAKRSTSSRAPKDVAKRVEKFFKRVVHQGDMEQCGLKEFTNVREHLRTSTNPDRYLVGCVSRLHGVYQTTMNDKQRKNDAPCVLLVVFGESLGKMAQHMLLHELSKLDRSIGYWEEQQAHPWRYRLHKHPRKWLDPKPQSQEIKEHLSALKKVQKKYLHNLGKLTMQLDSFSDTATTKNKYQWVVKVVNLIHSIVCRNSCSNGHDQSSQIEVALKNDALSDMYSGVCDLMIHDLTMLPIHKHNVERQVRTSRMPRYFTRHWLRYTLLGAASAVSAGYLFWHRNQVPTWRDSAIHGVKKFFHNHFAGPLKEIKDMFFTDRKSTYKKEQDVLVKQAEKFYKRYYRVVHPGRRSVPKKKLEQFKKDIRNQDMAELDRIRTKLRDRCSQGVSRELKAVMREVDKLVRNTTGNINTTAGNLNTNMGALLGNLDTRFKTLSGNTRTNANTLVGNLDTNFRTLSGNTKGNANTLVGNLDTNATRLPGLSALYTGVGPAVAPVTGGLKTDGQTLLTTLDTDAQRLSGTIKADGTRLSSQLDTDGTQLSGQLNADGTQLSNQLNVDVQRLSNGANADLQAVSGALRRRTHNMWHNNMRLVTDAYALTIDLMKVKMNNLLDRQRLNINLTLLIPLSALAYTGYKVGSKTYSWLRPTRYSAQQVRKALNEINRVLNWYAGEESRTTMSFEDQGKLLYYVHKLKVETDKFPEQQQDLMLSDVKELRLSHFTVRQKMEIVKRMRHYDFLYPGSAIGARIQ